MDREMGVPRDFETFLSKLGTIPENKTKFYLHAEDSRAKSIDQKGSLPWEETLEKAKNVIRLRHYSLSTEKTYLGWIGRFEISPHPLISPSRLLSFFGLLTSPR